MSSKVRVRRSALSRTVQDMVASAESESRKLCMDFTRGVAREARVRAPGPPPSQYPPRPTYVRTGRLRKSIKARKVRDGKWEVEVGAPYGIYVEYGTRHMRAEPYFRPAIESQKAVFRQRLGRIFR